MTSEEQDPFDMPPEGSGSTTRLLRVINDPDNRDKVDHLDLDVEIDLEDLLELEDVLNGFLTYLRTPVDDGSRPIDHLDRARVQDLSCVLDDIVRSWVTSLKSAMKDEFPESADEEEG